MRMRITYSLFKLIISIKKRKGNKSDREKNSMKTKLCTHTWWLNGDVTVFTGCESKYHRCIYKCITFPYICVTFWLKLCIIMNINVRTVTLLYTESSRLRLCLFLLYLKKVMMETWKEKNFYFICIWMGASLKWKTFNEITSKKKLITHSVEFFFVTIPFYIPNFVMHFVFVFTMLLKSF